MGPLNSTISRRLRAFLILPAGLAILLRNKEQAILFNGLIECQCVPYTYIHTYYKFLIYANVMLESRSTPMRDTPQIVKWKKGLDEVVTVVKNEREKSPGIIVRPYHAAAMHE